MSDSTLNSSASIETVAFEVFTTITSYCAYLGTTGQNTTSAANITNGGEEKFADLVSAATLHLFVTVVNGLLLPVLVLCGVTGNVINMAVFLRQGLRDRVNVCLFSLALSDIGFNLFHYASRIYALFYLFDVTLAEYWELFLTVVNGLLLPVLVLCGVTGNVINMAVFLRQGLRDRVNICLFSLAVSDTGFNLFHYASRIYALFYLFDVTLAEYWE
ncbi:hypothetical protein BaRGS_00032112, partial [Batillaria attramentaria]